MSVAVEFEKWLAEELHISRKQAACTLKNPACVLATPMWKVVKVYSELENLQALVDAFVRLTPEMLKCCEHWKVRAENAEKALDELEVVEGHTDVR